MVVPTSIVQTPLRIALPSRLLLLWVLVPWSVVAIQDVVHKHFGRKLRAEVWLTTFNLTDASPLSILEPNGSLHFDKKPANKSRLNNTSRIGGHSKRQKLTNTRNYHPEPILRCSEDEMDECIIEPPPNWNVHSPNRTAQEKSLWSSTQLKPKSVTVNVDPSATLQEIVGFGASMTQASAVNLLRLKTNAPEVYKEVLNRLFSPDNNGAGISFVRFPIGSCDFATEEYTENDVEQPPCAVGRECNAGCSSASGKCSTMFSTLTRENISSSIESDECQCSSDFKGTCQACCCLHTDYQLRNFELHPETIKILEVLRDATAVAPDLQFMASPWSPPRWLKSGMTLNGLDDSNTLLDNNLTYHTYARYLKKFADACDERGVTLKYITLQNEPMWGKTKYPGMFLSPDHAAKLGTIAKSVMGDSPQILAFDHNWAVKNSTVTTYPQDVIGKSPGSFAGTAFHCYRGDMASVQDALHEDYPNMPMFGTECSGSFPDETCDPSRDMDDYFWNYYWEMSNVYLGSVLHWASSGMRWNIALDEYCGPTLPNLKFSFGKSLIMVPTDAMTIEDVKFNGEFWTMSHMSRFVKAGAQRMNISISDPDIEESALIGVFKDKEGLMVTLVAFNKHDTRELALDLVYEGKMAHYIVPPWGTTVMKWPVKPPRPNLRFIPLYVAIPVFGLLLFAAIVRGVIRLFFPATKASTPS